MPRGYDAEARNTLALYGLPPDWDGHSAGNDKDVSFQGLNQTTMEGIFKAACALFRQAVKVNKVPQLRKLTAIHNHSDLCAILRLWLAATSWRTSSGTSFSESSAAV